MKQCPNCQTVYPDDSMRFCLNDGANLISAPEEAAETIRMSFDKNPSRVDVAPVSVPTYFPPVSSLPSSVKKSPVGLIITGILGLLLLLVIGGLAAFILLRPADNKNSAAVTSTPTVSPTITPNNETAKFKEEMANLQKQLQDQKNQQKSLPAETFSPPKESPTTARANSPRDGFLALRSEPNAETGNRIAKIPHGATLTVVACPKSSNAGKIAGRWCQVIYNGQAGWAFDAFMIF